MGREPASTTGPRKRVRKRKRRAVSTSSSSSSSSSSESSDSDADTSPQKTKEPSPAPIECVQTSESESSSDTDSDTSREASPAAPDADQNTQNTRSKQRSLSPSPPPATIPPFLPPKNGMEDDARKEQTLKDRFRKFWMASIGEGFKDDLEEIRKEPNFGPSRLSLLIESLASGADVFNSSPRPGNDINEMEVVLDPMAGSDNL